MSQTEIIAVVVVISFVIVATLFALAGGDRRLVNMGGNSAARVKGKWLLGFLIGFCQFMRLLLRAIWLGSLLVVILHPFIWLLLQMLIIIASGILTGFVERGQDRVWRMY